MAQVILDVHASNADTALEWVGDKNTTYTKMEGILQRASAKGFCTIKDCFYRTGRWLRMLQHIESHFALYLCTCGYFSSYRDTTTKHGHTHHHEEKPAVMEVDLDNYHVACRFIVGLPETAPTLPAKPKDPRKDCIPRRRYTTLTNYQIPRIFVAAVATSAVGDCRSVEDLAAAKVPKGTSSTLMTWIEAIQKRTEVRKRLGCVPRRHTAP